MLLLAARAFASTVAVLPLEQGAGGQAYDGLGKALAGMLVTDLSQAPGITLVERARLDALLAEISLTQTGFLDEASAQKLGRGVGAEFVVTGSYSVVAGQFLLDARLVGVESAKVVRAADAHGPVDSFVEVEKRLVTGLLDGLAVSLAEDARQRLLATAPTQDFDAFASYGEGLARQDEGKVAEAQAAFGEALAQDPSFREAATALGGLRMKVDGLQADRMRKQKKARADLLDKVLAAWPDERTLTGPPARDHAAGFGLRLLALQEQGRDCQRYEEMRHYLDRVGWKVGYPKGGWEKFWPEILKLAVGVGLAPTYEQSPQGNREVEHRIQSDVAPLFASTANFLYDFPTMLLSVPSSSDMLTSMTRCMAPPEQLFELARVREAVAAHGVGAQSVSGYAVPLTERLQWTEMAVRARWQGVDAAMSATIATLLAAHGSEGDLAFFLTGEARQIVQFGEAVERARVMALGFRERELQGVIAAVAAADATRLVLDRPVCAEITKTQLYWARAMAGVAPYAGISAMIAPLRDFGCLAGEPGRFDTPAQAFDYVATAPSRARPENAEACRAAFTELPERTTATRYGAPVERTPRSAYDALAWYYGSLVFPLCVTEL